MTLGTSVPKMIRVSIGSAIVLRLANGNLDALPTTVYLLTYRKNKCTANCAFCPQARNSTSRADMLSRVSWPLFKTAQVADRIEAAAGNGKAKRVCIQALNYPGVFDDVLSIVSIIRSKCTVPISVSCQPVTTETMKKLAEAGVDRVGIPLDAANEEIFDKVKGQPAEGPYSWKKQLQTLAEAVQVFGKGNVSTHLIVGLGESEEDMVSAVQRCVDMGVCPGLFAFTPVSGTALESVASPPIDRYRRVQLARYLIVEGKTKYENVRFDGDGRINDFGIAHKVLERVIMTGFPFLTSGCPDCNRPYYNEKPGGPMYNYPCVPTDEDLQQVKKGFKC